MSEFWVLRDAERLGNLLKYLTSLPLGKGLTVRIEKPGKTPAQRALWHNMVRVFATHEGTTEREMKDALKLAFLGKVIKRDLAGAEHHVLPSTEELTKEHYSLLIDKTALAMQEREIPFNPRHFGLEG